MGIRFLKPITPGSRFRNVSTFDLVTSNQPYPPLTVGYHQKKGRNNLGRITSRHRGGGHKKNYRYIDTKRNKLGVFGKVQHIEYDPNRNALIALIHYEHDGEKRYILYPKGLKIGDAIGSGEHTPIIPGNAMPLKNIPLSTYVHNIEFQPGSGGKLARSAGTSAQILAKDSTRVILRLPSSEIRMVLNTCWATIGEVGNAEIKNIRLGKAGRKRWLGFRPHVRGSAMNPCDHPHGGGEGRTPIGRSSPVTPWGKPTLGKKTRKVKKYRTRNQFILQRREKEKQFY